VRAQRQLGGEHAFADKALAHVLTPDDEYLANLVLGLANESLVQPKVLLVLTGLPRLAPAHLTSSIPAYHPLL
jgi:hypothetical protein